MDFPKAKGLEEVKLTDALVIKQCIYGLVQAAQQYPEKAVQILFKIRFEGGDVNRLCYVHRSKKGVVFLAIYMDNSLLIWHKLEN